jgi:hypothetical protein
LTILQYKANETITLMTQGRKPCGFGNFVKLGGGAIFHDNEPMALETLFVG